MFKRKRYIAFVKALRSIEKEKYTEPQEHATHSITPDQSSECCCGWLLELCQLMNDPKYHKTWNISSAKFVDWHKG